MNKLKVLVLGANGQLGRCIRDEYDDALVSYNYGDCIEITFAARQEIEYCNYPTLICDICDYEQLRKTIIDNNFNIVVNCAAYTNVNLADTDGKEISKKTNADAVGDLAKICKDANCKLIHISTDYVFSGSSAVKYEDHPYVEDLHPLQEYGNHKLEGEQNILKIMNDKDYMIIRTSSVYSQYGNNFVLTMIKKFSKNEDVSVVVDSTSSPTLANDLASCIIDNILIPIATNKKEFVPGIYHYSNEGVISWYDFACTIKELYNIYYGSGTISKILPITTEQMKEKSSSWIANRPASSILSKEKIKKTYNVEIPYWKTSLDEFIWYVHPTFYK